MIFRSFRTVVFLRVLMLTITITLFSYLVVEPELLVMVKIVLGLFILYQIYRLIYFIEKTNRDLDRFFRSIRNDDFTQSFSSGTTGDSMDQLRESFNRVTSQFLKLRSEKEEHARYLQTVITHVGVGLLCYKTNGEVELLNDAAKQLLNIRTLKNIKALEDLSGPLVETLLELKSGESSSFKIEIAGRVIYLSIHATQFKIQAEFYTLISLKDIQPEIEREHLAKELEIAWTVQESLFPANNPEIPGFDIAGMCQPAKVVGGDYYDFIPVGPGKLAMVIGDVSGKGASASFYMTLTKGYIQSNMNENTTPKEVLTRVNELMLETISKRSFVTMFIAILDWDSGKIVCSRAGHNPALYYPGKSSDTVSIKPGGLALGLRDTNAFSGVIEEYQLQLEENDWLLLYTDGFTEAMDVESNEFGENRLIAAVKEYQHLNAQELVKGIYNGVVAFSGKREQFDDMTMIAVKRTPKV